MTNYIEEMMRMAGVEKKVTETCYEFYKENNGIDIWDFCRKYLADKTNSCDVCPQRKFKEKLPDFTPAKQLEIIKLISSTYYGFHCYDNCRVSAHTTTRHYGIGNVDFSQALAQLTTELMKAGELDKEKVKEILNG